MMNAMRLSRRLVTLGLLIAAVLLALAIPACKSTGGGISDSPCSDEDGLAKDNNCFAATVLTQGSPFPNPVQKGGTVKLKMKIGAVNSQFSPIPAVVSTRVINSTTGAFINQQTQASLPPSSGFQDVPIWTNIDVAPDVYVLEVTVSVGDCGFKRICLTGQQRVEVQ